MGRDWLGVLVKETSSITDIEALRGVGVQPRDHAGWRWRRHTIAQKTLHNFRVRLMEAHDGGATPEALATQPDDRGGLRTGKSALTTIRFIAVDAVGASSADDPVSDGGEPTLARRDWGWWPSGGRPFPDTCWRFRRRRLSVCARDTGWPDRFRGTAVRRFRKRLLPSIDVGSHRDGRPGSG